MINRKIVCKFGPQGVSVQQVIERPTWSTGTRRRMKGNKRDEDSLHAADLGLCPVCS